MNTLVVVLVLTLLHSIPLCVQTEACFIMSPINVYLHFKPTRCQGWPSAAIIELHASKSQRMLQYMVYLRS